jgi:hypothetical protein
VILSIEVGDFFYVEGKLSCFASHILKTRLRMMEGRMPVKERMRSKGDIVMSHAKYAFLALVMIAFAGCGRTGQDNAAQQQPPAAAQPENTPPEQPQSAPENSQQATTPSSPNAPANSASTAAPQHAKAPASAAGTTQPRTSTAAPGSGLTPSGGRTPATTATPTAAEPKYATLAGGTQIPVRLETPLDSSLNKSGDAFSAVLDKDIVVDGEVVAPRGSALEGKLSHVERSGRLEGRAAMSLHLTSMTVGDKVYPLQTETIALQADSTKKSDAKKVGIGAGLGAVIGAIAGGGKGAAIGAAVGAGAGGATVVATRGKELKFDVEQKFSFLLRDNVKVRLR